MRDAQLFYFNSVPVDKLTLKLLSEGGKSVYHPSIKLFLYFKIKDGINLKFFKFKDDAGFISSP